MRIAVIGAGISGLTAAAGLQRSGHDVVIFERREDPSPVGAGLTLFDNAFEALDLIGLGDGVRAVSSEALRDLRSGFRDPSGRWLLAVPERSVAAMRSVHRVNLHRALAGRLEPGTLRTGAAAAVPQDGSARVTVGERTEEFDLVVGADGIRSRARQTLGLDTGLRYAGCTAWRGVTAEPVDLDGAAGETIGRGRIFGSVPLPDGRVYWYATLNAPADAVFRNEGDTLRIKFGRWHESVRRCIDATPADSVMRHDIYDLAKPLRSFVHGRVVLMGDAAHAMTPNLGQGAGQGIEDAATLVHLLRDAAPSGIDAALERYCALRQPRTSAVMRRSRAAGAAVQAAGALTAGLRTAALRLLPGPVMGRMSRRLLVWPEP
ncbi:FAD-dependent oxidoreductase [Gulosibacter sp. 10]|uniref:FAD-dependent oxidoreductase n=1 Tax=Gulosibacter sp. 10 TaxID=1255570 RepID=UPI00097E956B|nr:FAD-dependent oxidoreductase [Gulosibacter sp. 10]SJM61805.1 putative monooxygenase [Gulosibacter sp. 10]